MPSIFYSTVIRSKIERVWEEIRDFGQLAAWHPLISDCEIENAEPADRVGCIRRFHLEDGSLFRERLVSLNDFKKTFSYEIVESPLPITNYVATVKLAPITEELWTFVTWSSSFNCPPESESELAILVENGVYKSGLDAIKEILS